jgi:hypothetical protein
MDPDPNSIPGFDFPKFKILMLAHTRVYVLACPSYSIRSSTKLLFSTKDSPLPAPSSPSPSINLRMVIIDDKIDICTADVGIILLRVEGEKYSA